MLDNIKREKPPKKMFLTTETAANAGARPTEPAQRDGAIKNIGLRDRNLD